MKNGHFVTPPGLISLTQFFPKRKLAPMRIKIWMIAVASVVLCALWIALFVATANQNDQLLVFRDDGASVASAWHVNLNQIGRLLTEIGVTALAALTVGFWTAKRPK
jgi:hypothetical protein